MRRARKKQPVTNEEMQQTMEFIVEMQKRTDTKLRRLSKKAGGKPTETRAERRWRDTEQRLRTLLTKARAHERKMAAERKRLAEPQALLTSRNAPVDRRIKALSDLFERKSRERRRVKKTKRNS